MYTKLDDMKMVEIITYYLSKTPNATRTKIAKDCYTNFHRLKYLEEEGLITLPPPMDRGLRNGKKINEGKSNEVSISM